jgi:hypothetical protein
VKLRVLDPNDTEALEQEKAKRSESKSVTARAATPNEREQATHPRHWLSPVMDTVRQEVKE